MDKSQSAIGIIIAIVILAAAYFIYFRPSSEPPKIEEDVMSETIPAPTDVAGIPADATIVQGGIGMRFLQQGDGENFPTIDDDVTIHYTGWQTDGAMFDSSRPRGEPNTFPLTGLIQGWQLAMPHMSKGSKALIWIPGPLAYEYPGARPDAPKGMLVFEIELFDFAPAEGR